jgi:hypothetical protein
LKRGQTAMPAQNVQSLIEGRLQMRGMDRIQASHGYDCRSESSLCRTGSGSSMSRDPPPCYRARHRRAAYRETPRKPPARHPKGSGESSYKPESCLKPKTLLGQSAHS